MLRTASAPKSCFLDLHWLGAGHVSLDQSLAALQRCLVQPNSALLLSLTAQSELSTHLYDAAVAARMADIA